MRRVKEINLSTSKETYKVLYVCLCPCVLALSITIVSVKRKSNGKSLPRTQQEAHGDQRGKIEYDSHSCGKESPCDSDTRDPHLGTIMRHQNIGGDLKNGCVALNMQR